MDDFTGKTIKGYELRERLGEGGFGQVYRAFQPAVGREVAIKVILPQFANQPDFIRRFETEARLVARLEHFHIVPIFDFWRDPDGAFLVMRWLRGGSLSDALRRGPWSPGDCARLLDQMAAALSVAHRNGIVHRDIKPGNILLDAEHNAYLADFGIAKGFDDSFELANKDTLIGSPAYVSPEQIRSEAITPRTDVYALGIMLFEMLSGEHPYAGESAMNLLYRHLDDPMPPLRADVAEELTDKLDAVLQRATAKDPEDRFPSVLALSVSFRQALNVIGDPFTVLDYGETSELLPVDTTTQTDGAALLDLQNPYKGLRAFHEADAEEFFGRETLIQQIMEHLSQAGADGRFLAVIGPSGGGKSSVVEAGVLPRLRRGALPDSEYWFFVQFFPSASPMQELEAALLRVASDPAQSLFARLRSTDNSLNAVINHILPPDESELVMVIDQFEEVFTLVADEAERAHFLSSLYHAVTAPDSRLRLILTLRADFYDRPLLYADFGSLVRQHTEVVLPLNPAELREAIVGPATQAGLRLESGLVEAIIADVSQQPGALPLLQYALTELFERRRGLVLSREVYREIGGALGALARRAEELYSNLDPRGQEITRQMFLRLVTLGEGVEDTRRRVMQSELLSVDVSAEHMGRVIEIFGKYRLLTFDNHPVTRAPTVEVAHEALIREWRRVREWLGEARADLQLHRRLIAATEEWLISEHDPSFLASGARLVQLEAWQREASIALNENEREYLDASFARRDREAQAERERQAREAELEQRSRSRLRALAAVLAVAAVIALALSVLAFNQRQEARQQQRSAEANALEAQQNANIAEANAFRAQANLQDARANASRAQRNADEAQSLALAASAQQALRDFDSDLALALALQANRLDNPPLQAQSTLAEVAYDPGTRTVFNTPQDWVYSVSLSPDGAQALSGSLDGSLIVWDVNTGAQRAFESTGAPVFSTAFSPNGRYALAGHGEDLILWNLADASQIRSFSDSSGSVLSIAFSPDGRSAIVGTADGNLILWDIETGAALAHYGQPDGGSVYSVAFSPDGERILSGASGGQLILWDITTGAVLQRFKGHTDSVSSVAFSPDGSFIVSGSWDKTVRLWNIANASEISRLTGHRDAVNSVAFSPRGDILATSSSDGTLRLWNLQDGSEFHRYVGHGASVTTIAFSPDGHTILSGAANGSMRLWNVESGAEVRRYGDGAFNFFDARLIAGQNSIVASSINGGVSLWDLSSGDRFRQLNSGEAVFSEAVSPDGGRVALGLADGRIRVLNSVDGSLVRLLTGHSSAVSTLAFSPDGTRLVSGSRDYSLRLWNINTGEEIARYSGHSGTVNSVAYSPDGTTLASASRDRLIILWDAVNGGELRRLAGHTDSVLSVDFSPDGTQLLSGSLDHTLRLWEVATGQEATRLLGHTDGVTSVRFSPNGELALSGSRDATVRVWDMDSGIEVRQLIGHSGAVNSVTFSADGSRALSSAQDRSLRLWYISPLDELLQWTQENRYVRDFTCNEREQYRVEPLCGAE